MAKVLSYTPAWLSKPNPGHSIFTASPSNPTNTLSSSNKRSAKPGPRRTIAHRGTEVFVAVGKEIRWADLIYLKEAWEDNQKTTNKGKGTAGSRSQYEENHAQGYRTIKTQVAEDIRQLIISPNDNLIAILTTHTVHISCLPDSSQLTAIDPGPMKLKTYTLGSTTHVTSRSGIVSALWHPLGVNGNCLVTVTEDAVVRVWELSVADRWSFDKPTLSIDLKKLADGTSVDQDFGASLGQNKGFSPDSFEMEVASACFPSRASGGWSPMTLWVAMREGDVYALCPLLPEKWSPPDALIPSLTLSVLAKVAATEDDADVPQEEKTLAQQQLQWMVEIDSQDPPEAEQMTPGDYPAKLYNRPHKPGRVPKLQGPFDLELLPEESEDELASLLSDIFVIGAKFDADDLMSGEEIDLEMNDADQEGLSLAVICLLSSSGRLSLLLDLDGVEAQWLPKSNAKAFRAIDEADPPSLLTVEVLDTLTKEEQSWEGDWPIFSPDLSSRYSFYITNTSDVTFVSLPWAFTLEKELSTVTAGVDFRIDLFASGKTKSIRERLYTQKPADASAPLTASTLIRDPDLGCFLLTASPYGPVSLSFENPEVEIEFRRSQTRSPTFDSEPEEEFIPPYEPRPVYEPGHALEQASGLPQLLEKLRQGQKRRVLKEEVRLSRATLEIMTDVHKTVSDENYRIGQAASELFRRCERLRIELQTQIKQVKELNHAVEEITGEDANEDEQVLTSEERIQQRIQAAQTMQEKLIERIEKVKRTTGKGLPRELSDKEKAWVEEVKNYESKVIGEWEDVGGEQDNGKSAVKEPWARYEQAQRLHEELMEEAKEIEVQEAEKGFESAGVRVPSDIRKAKMEQVKRLLERESALVEGAKSRLERLSLA